MYGRSTSISFRRSYYKMVAVWALFSAAAVAVAGAQEPVAPDTAPRDTTRVRILDELIVWF